MPKAKLKEKVVATPAATEDAGIQIRDLSVEKRIEMYQAVVKKFDEEMSKVYGISLGVELKFSPNGIVPRMVLIDLLAKKNEGKQLQAAPTQEETPKA